MNKTFITDIGEVNVNIFVKHVTVSFTDLYGPFKRLHSCHDIEFRVPEYFEKFGECAIIEILTFIFENTPVNFKLKAQLDYEKENSSVSKPIRGKDNESNQLSLF